MDTIIFDKIKNHILKIEQEHDVKIIFAAESGSRVWGFESEESDYDVRFIYAHKRNWYLNILPKRDVIEYPIVDEFDYSGWDLRKTLFLLSKSNPTVFEWLHSPIVYRKDEFSFRVLEKLQTAYFSPIASLCYYLHTAQNHFKHHLQKEEVRIKKYFYALRPLLACFWIEKYNAPPPMRFQEMFSLIEDNALLDAIHHLLNRKISGDELGTEPKIEKINDYLLQSFQHFETAAGNFYLLKKQKRNQQLLEDGFVEMLDYLEM